MKEFLRYAVILGLVIFGLYMLYPAIRPVNETPAPAVSPTNNSSPTVAATSTSNPAAAGAPGLPNVPTALPNPSAGDLSSQAGSPAPVTVDTNAVLSSAAVLESMRRVIHGYNTEFGENPVGNNAEITRALMGENPRHINFIQPDTGLNVNANGELVDAWGTPFFFHQLSAQVMEIHSAGPDRKMWTSDDSVAR